MLEIEPGPHPCSLSTLSTELSAQSVIYLISYCSLPLFNPATLNFFFLITNHMFLLWQVFTPSFSLDVHSPSVPLNKLSSFQISSIAGWGILLRLTRISQFCSLISHSTIQFSLGMLSKFVVISFFNFFSFEVKNVIVCFCINTHFVLGLAICLINICGMRCYLCSATAELPHLAYAIQLAWLYVHLFQLP